MTVAATGSSVDGELAIEGRRDTATQAEYRAMTKAVADSTGCAFLDLYDAWASTVGAGWDAAWAAGLMHDSLHPTQLGHDDIAARVQVALGLDPTVRKRTTANLSLIRNNLPVVVDDPRSLPFPQGGFNDTLPGHGETIVSISLMSI